jgi:uncharacterized protein YcfJ
LTFTANTVLGQSLKGAVVILLSTFLVVATMPQKVEASLLGGALGGAVIGGIVGGKKGARTGAIVGGIAGALRK